jgi:DNA-directed RNA polymerase subunit RPC12/RpoP
MSDEIRCEHCGSTKVIKSEGHVGVRPAPPDIVDNWSVEADDSMGKETLFHVYFCLDCGEEFYEEFEENLVS